MIKMKGSILFALLLPSLAFAQVAPKVKAGLIKPKTPATANISTGTGFVINGEVKGYPDGTHVSLLNGQSGASEQESTVTANKFTFKGKSFYSWKYKLNKTLFMVPTKSAYPSYCKN